MADSPHGLKDLFGSMPDAGERSKPAQEPDNREGAASVQSQSTPTIDGVPHGFQNAFGGGAAPSHRPDASHVEPSPAQPGAAPALDAPNLTGLPSGITPEAPAAPVAPTAYGAAALSCVVLARGGIAAAQRTIQALRIQTVASMLDVVIVASEQADVDAQDFASLRSVVAPGQASYGEMAALGAQSARGELVAILDDYAFPARDWAEAVLTHRHDRFAAMGSALTNANPRSPMSWSNMLLEHGQWRDGLAGGDVERLPARNLVYRRDALLRLGPDLPHLLESGRATAMLARDGAPLKMEEGARLAILNPSTRKATLTGRFAAGRLDAANWSKNLSMPKRVGKALKAAFGGPARYTRDKGRVFYGSDPTVNPKLQGRAVMLAMTAEGLGRAAGYLRGPGKASATRERMVVRRSSTLNRVDRKQFRS